MLAKQEVETHSRDRMIFSVHPPLLLAVHLFTVWVVRALHAVMMFLGQCPHIYPQHTSVSTRWPVTPHNLVHNAPELCLILLSISAF